MHVLFKCKWNIHQDTHYSLLWNKSQQTSKGIAIVPSLFPDHKIIKLEINIKTSRKVSHIWKLNSTHLNNPWVKEEITRGKMFWTGWWRKYNAGIPYFSKIYFTTSSLLPVFHTGKRAKEDFHFYRKKRWKMKITYSTYFEASLQPPL